MDTMEMLSVLPAMYLVSFSLGLLGRGIVIAMNALLKNKL